MKTALYILGAWVCLDLLAVWLLVRAADRHRPTRQIGRNR